MLVLIFGPDNVSSYQKFKDLYECYHLKLIRLIWCYVRDIAIAEDLAQDVYLQIFCIWNKSRNPEEKKRLLIYLQWHGEPVSNTLPITSRQQISPSTKNF